MLLRALPLPHTVCISIKLIIKAKEEYGLSEKKIIKFKRKKNKKLFKKIYRIIRIPLAVLAVAFAVFLCGKMLGEVAISNITDTFRQIPYVFTHGGGYPYSIEESSDVKIRLIGDSPAIVGADSLTVLSSTARKMNEVGLSNANSKIITRGGRALIYADSSNTLILSGKTEELETLTLESAVFSAALSENGKIAAAFPSSQAQSVLAVYGRTGKEIFRWNCSKEYISALALSPNGKNVAVAAIGTENAQIYSKFLIFNVKKTEPSVQVRLDSSMILKLISISSGRVIAVCDNCTVVFNKSGEKLLEINYGDDSLISAVSDSKGNTLLCYKESGGSKIIAAKISASGKLTATVSAETQPDCTSVRGGRFVLVSGKTVTEYASSGKERRKFETNEEASQVMLASNCVYTLENSQLCKY